MNKHVLISGGTGFVGSYLIPQLEARNCQVSVVTRERGNSDARVFEVSELANLDKVDTFVHLACCYGRKGETWDFMMKSNVEYGLSILEPIMHDGLEIINIGTALPPEMNFYARTKEIFLEEIRRRYGSNKIVHLRLEHFFGPYNTSFVSFLISHFFAGKASVDLTGGNQKRDFIYYKDLLAAMLCIFENLNTFDRFEDVPVGSGQATSIRDVALEVQSVFAGDKTELRFGEAPLRPNEPLFSEADTQRLTGLGWKPEYDLHSALQDLKVELESTPVPSNAQQPLSRQ